MPERSLPAELSLELGLDEPDDAESLRTRAAKQLGVRADALPEVVLRRRSIDARRGRVRFQLLLSLGAKLEPLGGAPLREVRKGPTVIVVGDGPCGLFCAYELARAGIRAVVVDRGKEVSRGART